MENKAEDSDENKLAISDDEEPPEQVNNPDQSLRNFVEESKQEVLVYKVRVSWIRIIL